MVDELVSPAILRRITLDAARRMAGGWRPKRKRRGTGFMGLLLDRTPPGRAIVFRTARRQVLERTHGNYPAPLAAIDHCTRFAPRHSRINETRSPAVRAAAVPTSPASWCRSSSPPRS
jgi:hypothetical protein